MENLPSEIQWNIIKYMRHPVAELFRCESVEYIILMRMRARRLHIVGSDANTFYKGYMNWKRWLPTHRYVKP